jgi:hypothetical protein
LAAFRLGGLCGQTIDMYIKETKEICNQLGRWGGDNIVSSYRSNTLNPIILKHYKKTNIKNLFIKSSFSNLILHFYYFFKAENLNNNTPDQFQLTSSSISL